MTALRIFGKFLISVGVGVLLFVAWMLKGTDLYAHGQQRALSQEFADLVQEFAPPTAKGPPPGFRPGPGRAVFRMEIPAVDVDQIVVEGVGVEELKKGPGHYPECRPGFEKPLCTEFDEVYPGEPGRVVVSGHRTTYGAPFWAINELRRGDEINIDAAWGRFTYEVTRQEVVPPDSKAIVIPSNKPELVLTTCNPRYSAAERLVVFAEMKERPT